MSSTTLLKMLIKLLKEITKIIVHGDWIYSLKQNRIVRVKMVTTTFKQNIKYSLS